MSSAASFLLLGAVLAATLLLFAWVRRQRPRSPRRSIEQFHRTLAAISPRRTPPRG